MKPTLPGAFFEATEKYSSFAALLYKKDGTYSSILFGELAYLVQSAAAVLQSLGIKKGDRVALLSENRPEWVIADLAIQLAGGVVVPLHLTLSAEAMHEFLQHSRSSLLIASKKMDSEQFSQATAKIILLAELLAKPGAPFKKVTLHPQDVCTIIYTSGTTGIPKGVALTHENILSNVLAVAQLVPVKKGDVFLSFLPLSHVLERTVGYYIPLLFGAAIAYAESVKKLPENLQEVRPTILIAVPRIFEKFHDVIWDKINAGFFLKKKLFLWALRQHKGTFWYQVADRLVFDGIRSKFGGQLRLAICGGASINENLLRFFSKVGLTILEGYGLTETSPVIATNTQQFTKFRTVGKPVPGAMVRINEEKEILVKGLSIFKEYYHNAEATRQAFNEDGWFLTGDLGFVDTEGFLTIIGRKKDMFVLSGGKNIWPEPIENALNNDKFIAQSMVVGNKQKFVSALIVPDWQEVKNRGVAQDVVRELIEKRIAEKINPHFADFEQVKKIVIVKEPFLEANGELTPTLKLRRHIIAHRYVREIMGLYH